MIRFHTSRLFSPEDKLMFGNWLEYREMEAFEACDSIWHRNGGEFAKKIPRTSFESEIWFLLWPVVARLVLDEVDSELGQ